MHGISHVKIVLTSFKIFLYTTLLPQVSSINKYILVVYIPAVGAHYWFGLCSVRLKISYSLIAQEAQCERRFSRWMNTIRSHYMREGGGFSGLVGSPTGTNSSLCL